MSIPPFKLEEFWKRYEFTTPYVMCSSDAETWQLNDLIALADEECLKLWNGLSLGYTEPPGLPLLREEIARLYTSISRDQIFTFAGAEEGIYCLMRTLVEPGDHVIVIDPCYQSLATLALSFGGDLTRIALDPKKHWQLDLEQVAAAFRPETKLLVLNYPHNPTGTLLSRGGFEGLIKLARERGTYIFSDEVYRYLEIDERDRLPSITDAYERGITVNVMTKSFGLAGLRIGWLATQDCALLERVGGYKLYTSICNSGPSEILALIALRAKNKVLGRNRQILLENLSLLDSLIARYPDYISWIRPQSGTIGLIELLHPMSLETFFQNLVERMGVLVMPGYLFDFPGKFFRIGFGKQRMKESLDRFEQFLKIL